jgi:hypothetical protein
VSRLLCQTGHNDTCAEIASQPYQENFVGVHFLDKITFFQCVGESEIIFRQRVTVLSAGRDSDWRTRQKGAPRMWM